MPDLKKGVTQLQNVLKNVSVHEDIIKEVDWILLNPRQARIIIPVDLRRFMGLEKDGKPTTCFIKVILRRVTFKELNQFVHEVDSEKLDQIITEVRER